MIDVALLGIIRRWYIRDRVSIREIARKKNRRVRVATSDALEQIIILGSGALRISAGEFRREVEAANVEIASILERNRLAREKRSSVESAMRTAAEKKLRTENA